MRYERLSFLWNNPKTKPIMEEYIANLSEFTHTVVNLKKANKTVSLSHIYDKFNMLGEKKAVGELTRNINNEI